MISMRISELLRERGGERGGGRGWEGRESYVHV